MGLPTVLERSVIGLPLGPFAAACIDLYSRLWLELEQLGERLTAGDRSGSAVELKTRLAILRLELIVLLDACASARWQSMLGRQQRVELRSMLERLLRTLATPFDAVDGSLLADAQNQILDAVLTLCDVPENRTRAAVFKSA